MGKPKDLKTAAELSKNKSHGTRIKYAGGCRCTPCRAANSRYETERSAARKRGEWNGIVSAEKARKHIEELATRGVGYKSVADASNVGKTCVLKIKTGKKTHIRAETERRILSVTEEAVADGALIWAYPTWQKINWLLSQGFTQKSLAQRLGYKTPQLQIGKREVLASTALKVEQFYNRIRAGE